MSGEGRDWGPECCSTLPRCAVLRGEAGRRWKGLLPLTPMPTFRCAAPALQVADSRGLLCYLEASSARSQALYERHGFEHTADKPLGEDAAAPVLWVGVRPPAAAAAAAGSSS